MSYKELLEKDFDELLRDRSNSLGFKIYERQHYECGGALIKLKNNQLKIELLNDRGIITLELSSLYGREFYYSAELIASHIELSKEREHELSKWEWKKIAKNRIGLGEQINMFFNNYQLLIDLFSKSNFKATLKELDKLGTEAHGWRENASQQNL